MCGRVRLSSDVSEIKLVFSIPAHRPAPVMRWGVVSYWAKDIKVGFANINAKAEGIGSTAFRAAFRRRRCLVPVDSFYEWKKTMLGKHPVLLRSRAVG
jgi:putative SOS response-associated peptidase YedK